jgi:hypothetical protein
MGVQYPSPQLWTKAEDYVRLPAWLGEKKRRASTTYYFHLREGGNFLQDEEGMDLPDLEAVKLEAFRGARSILAAYHTLGTSCADGLIEVQTADGLVVMKLPLRTIRPPHDARPVGLASIGARSA